MIHQLPVELQRHCIHFIRDVSTLRSLRLVNKAGAAVGTEALFSTVNLFPDNTSAKKYEEIVKDTRMNALVKTVVFHTSFPNQLFFDDRRVWEVIESLNLLPSFQRVKAVQLKFAQECSVNPKMIKRCFWKLAVVETITSRTNTLFTFFDRVAETKNIESLTIKNLQCYTEKSVFRFKAFPHVIGQLKQLHLQGTTEGSYEGQPVSQPEQANMRARGDFFASDLFEHWLFPTKGQLTHLTLYMMCYWGIKPFCDLRPVVFPNLRSLALGKLTFAYDGQVDWIISHAEKLESLVLDDCPIVLALWIKDNQGLEKWPIWDRTPYAAGLPFPAYSLNFDLRWIQVLRRFCKCLTRLNHFAMGCGDWPEQTMFEERYELLTVLEPRRYVVHDGRLEPNPWIEGGKENGYDLTNFDIIPEFPGDEENEEDEQALRELARVVKERAWSCTDL